MTTPTPAVAERLGPVHEMPGTRAAQATLDELRTRRADVEAQLMRGRTRPDAIGRAEAAVEEPRLLLDYRKLTAAIITAEGAVDAARAADTERARMQFHALKRPIVARLAAALRTAAAVSQELADLEQREHESTGGYMDPLAWPMLTRSAPDGTRTSLLDTWLAAARARGFDL